jgi:hypothetical protein
MKQIFFLSLALCLTNSGPFLVISHAQLLHDAVLSGSPVQQTETDEYTRYELLDPQTASFKIYYEVTATSPGAKVFYNPIRKGSIASDESVFDAMTGAPLHFEVVSGSEARKDSLMSKASLDMDYIRVQLARPVPQNGQGRVLILKTYKDPKSYYVDGNTIVFNRPLGIRRNKVVLPAGYEVVGCTVPSQILTEKDGRIAISFMHVGSGEAPLILRAVKDAQTGEAALPRPLTQQRSSQAPFSREVERERLSERAHQNTDTTYFLQQPETHSFRLDQNYTESRPGISSYINVVREGDRVTDPSAYILDTGETLPVKIMSKSEIQAAKIDVGEPLGAKGQAIVISFRPVVAGQTLRLRTVESYNAPASYGLEGNDLVFDRSLNSPRSAIVLPSGWYCTASVIPAVVHQLPDGRIQLEYWDDQPDPVDALVRAKRRMTP